MNKLFLQFVVKRGGVVAACVTLLTVILCSLTFRSYLASVAKYARVQASHRSVLNHQLSYSILEWFLACSTEMPMVPLATAIVFSCLVFYAFRLLFRSATHITVFLLSAATIVIVALLVATVCAFYVTAPIS